MEFYWMVLNICEKFLIKAVTFDKILNKQMVNDAYSLLNDNFKLILWSFLNNFVQSLHVGL